MIDYPKVFYISYWAWKLQNGDKMLVANLKANNKSKSVIAYHKAKIMEPHPKLDKTESIYLRL